ncbi:hypothetical protein Btru_063113 [Bulinus truncatus]|nr:hypothetical protein Btru_063113 [Bulinus truncatus]
MGICTSQRWGYVHHNDKIEIKIILIIICFMRKAFCTASTTMLFPAALILLFVGQLSAKPVDKRETSPTGLQWLLSHPEILNVISRRALPDWIKQPILPKRQISLAEFILNNPPKFIFDPDTKRQISLAEFILNNPPKFVFDPDTKRQISLAEFILNNPPKFIFDPDTKRQISLAEFILNNPPKFIFDPDVRRQKNAIDWASLLLPQTANVNN